ncbi:hypothetical protein NB717_003936 [Xanthomonas sacchari]|nr:hypothetical protein [Xanthomonas sacchari]MCW0440789.1 hypothetical protein [Xanthomonas sacchari]MCW0462868.1 hypothetical protein [Xanthomonas sacchari]
MYEWYMRIPSTVRARLVAAQSFCRPRLDLRPRAGTSRLAGFLSTRLD